MAHAFGQVVLVPFPFTDQSGAKKRPAVIVSTDAYNTSRLTDWQAAGLIKPSVIKPVFATIEQGLVLRTLGTLSGGDLRALRGAIAQIIG
jgi:mRNA interferase MazF